MSSISIINEKCIGCKKCISACPFGAIKVENKKAVILDNCTLCGACVESCKFAAIDLQIDDMEHASTEGYEGVWVFAEEHEGRLRGVALELLGQAQNLAKDLDTKVTAVLLAADAGNMANELIAYGADEVLLAEDKNLKHFNDQTYTSIITELVKQYKPDIFLLGATARGRSLAPRIAAHLETGLTADCTCLEIDKDSKLLWQTRPAFGGNLMATIYCPYNRPQMSTVRPRVFKPLEPDFNRKGGIIKVPVLADMISAQVRFLKKFESQDEDINIADQEVIIGVGKGIGSVQNLKAAEKLASLLGGAVGASRALVDTGMIAYSRQIGQTGKTVNPKLYIACGISGAIQHVSGMSSADRVIAINNDPDAPIFSIAHYGIVGDCSEVIPELIRQLENKE